MEHRHEVLSGAELLVAREAFFRMKMSDAAKADLMFMAMLCNVRKESSDVGD